MFKALIQKKKDFKENMLGFHPANEVLGSCHSMLITDETLIKLKK